MFQHFLITRFNLTPSNSNTFKNESVSDEWMDERLKIFSNYCFSSVKSQINKNFIWLVFFDTSTKEEHRDKINKLKEEFENFQPVYIDGMKSLDKSIQEEIKNRTDADYIITSRLDNDDSIHQEYIQEVQGNFNSQEYMAIDFINGITIDIHHQVAGKKINLYNPFISLIEKNKEHIDTVLCRKHGAWGKIKLVKSINNEKPLWLTVIHGDNVFNGYTGFGSVNKSLLEQFNISDVVMPEKNKKITKGGWLLTIKNRYKGYERYFLTTLRHKIRRTLNLIPEK